MLNELVLEELRMEREYDELIKEYEGILSRKESELTMLMIVRVLSSIETVGSEGVRKQVAVREEWQSFWRQTRYCCC